MAEPLLRNATYADLLEVPDHLVAEILEGELFATPRPGIPHTNAGSVLGSMLVDAFQLGRTGPGGWWIWFEPELHLGSNVLVPDIAGWRRERIPELPQTAAIEIAPDWVCEVISTSTGRLDRVKKMPIYAENGVEHAWLIDPSLRTLEVFRLDRPGWKLVATYGDDDRVRTEPFEAIEIDLLPLWGETR